MPWRPRRAWRARQAMSDDQVTSSRRLANSTARSRRATPTYRPQIEQRAVGIGHRDAVVHRHLTAVQIGALVGSDLRPSVPTPRGIDTSTPAVPKPGRWPRGGRRRGASSLPLDRPPALPPADGSPSRAALRRSGTRRSSTCDPPAAADPSRNVVAACRRRRTRRRGSTACADDEQQRRALGRALPRGPPVVVATYRGNGATVPLAVTTEFLRQYVDKTSTGCRKNAIGVGLADRVRSARG